MPALDITTIFTNLPANLRNELVATYTTISRNYSEHRWEPAELNGGKFSEVVYSILDGYLGGTYPTNASKPSNFLASCRALENIPSSSRAGDRSVRVLIPRAMIYLYEIRNNRGVGHVGGDVDPNLMDATAVISCASWIMAELVRIFHGLSTEEAKSVVNGLVERRTPLVWEANGIRRVLDTSLTTSEQILVLLYSANSWCSRSDLQQWTEYGNQTRFRSRILADLHTSRLIEYDHAADRAMILPPGITRVEDVILPNSGA